MMNGEEALAHGACAAGVGLVAGYPGSPGTGVLETLAAITAPSEVHVEWSANEKVALEVAIGASLGGVRALVCTKSVGMNALLDPLMTVNLTGVHAGLVLILGDDPGAYGSQNDQDSRPLAEFAEVPLLEPTGPAEAAELIEAAFELSETFATLVVIRLTRSFAVAEEPLEVPDGAARAQRLPPRRDAGRWVTHPRNAVARHRELHAKLIALGEWGSQARWNVVEGSGARGVVAAGFAWRKLRDAGAGALEGLRALKLVTLFPFPDDLVAGFLEGLDEVLVLEENEPWVENRLRALAQARALRTRVVGKREGHVAREGELFRWQIQESLAAFVAGFAPERRYLREDEASERPRREDHCAGCRFREILEALRAVASDAGVEPWLVGDPGCLVKAVDLLDAKYAMGSAAAVAQGVARADPGLRAVALFGDSAFFHTAIPAVISAVHNRACVLFVVIDNAATVTSGYQPNPGSGRDARGERAPRVSIEAIARACGVEWVCTVAEDAPPHALRATLRAGLVEAPIALVVVERRCESV